MTEDTTRKVIELFEKHRKEPGTEIEQSHFFDFLLKKPRKKGAFRDSFSGLRRFNAFWDEVQLEFGVCFSIKDRETDYSLEDFCKRIEQLKNSKRSSKSSLRNRAKFGFEWNIFILMNFILFGIALSFSSYKFVLAIVLVTMGYLNFKLVKHYLKEKKYVKELEVRIGN